MTDSRMLSSRGARVLRDAAVATECDERGPRAAVGTLWSNLHADRDVIRVVFDALGEAAGVSDVSGYLGCVLQRKTAVERAALCRAAADTLDQRLEEVA